MELLKSFLIEKQEENIHDILAKVKNAKNTNDFRDNTRAFALENDNGSIVKVFVRADQADNFESELSKALYDAKENGVEIPEVLYNLRKHFDIVDIEWNKGSIPEDEEQEIKPIVSDKPKTDLNAQPDDGMDELADLDTATPDLDSGNEDTLVGAITQVLDMLKADAEAKKADAAARKAEAEAKIAQEANNAAKLRAQQEEEILDMEDYNKKQADQKKNADTREKLIKYRHDQKKDQSKSSTNIGESMNVDGKKYPDATPEEEEILDMERWENEEKKKKDHMNTRERLIRFRNAKKHSVKKEEEEIKSKIKEVVSSMNVESVRTLRFGKFNTLVESVFNKVKK